MFYWVRVTFRSVTAALCILLASAHPALAQDQRAAPVSSGPGAVQTRAPLVLLLVSASASDNAIVAMLGERLNELQLETLTQSIATESSEAITRQAKRSAQRTNAAVVVWFNSQGDAPQLYTYDAHTDHTSVRRLPEAQVDAAAREEWLIIASTTVSALIEGQRDSSAGDAPARATSSEQTPPQKATPKTAPKAKAAGAQRPVEGVPPEPRALPPTADSTLELLLGYFGTSTLAEGGAWQNGASGSLLLWLPRRVHLGAGYAVLPAQSIAVGESQIEIERQPLSLALGLDSRAPWRHWQWLIADLSLSVDRVTRTTHSPEAVLVGTPAASRWLWDVGGRIGAAVTLVSNVSLYGHLGGKLGVSGFDYVAQGEQNEERTHIGQSTAQLELGLCVSVF